MVSRLKFLAPHLSADSQFRERFTREARAAAALNHPNIITIYEISELQDRVFFSMEYIDGNELRDVMDTKTLKFDEKLDLMIQICDGLAAAHKIGLMHRDIKPMNIVLDSHGRVRILDFGLAKIKGDIQLTQAGVAMGSVNYMSPEQGQGEEVDHRSDIFSTGILSG